MAGRTILTIIFYFTSQIMMGQRVQNLAEKLGYKSDAKLLIIHADDLGVSHSENHASILSLEKGSVNSASIMVPCPWFLEIAEYASKNRSLDFGVHLTLTSEWKYYKWGPVTSTDKVPSLINDQGHFYSTVDSMVRHAVPGEAETELRNQVKKALANGIDITHLDAHMHAARSTKALLSVYIKLGRELKVPVLLTSDEKDLESIQLTATDVVVDHLYQASPADYDKGMASYYTNLFRNLKPGLSCLLIHTAYDDNEMQAMTTGHIYWGSAWRKQDLDYFNSDDCKKLLQEQNIRLVTWREIRDKIIRKE